MTIKYDGNVLGQKSSTQEMKWRDNWRVALGASYLVTEKLTWRFGVAYDQTPTQNEYRNLKLPDANRYWISTGIGYKFNDHIRIDLAYTHLFMDSQSFTQQTAGGVVRAKTKCSTEICSFGITYTF